MLKRMTLIFMSLLISLAIIPVSADDIFYEAYTDSWNSFGFGREGQGNALRLKVEQPWEHIGVETTYAQSGGEGVLADNWEEYIEKGECVYWIQSAVFPADDIYVKSADTSDSAANEGYFLPKGATIDWTASNLNLSQITGSVKFTTKVRFDDKNATRYLFSFRKDVINESTGKKEKTYNDFFVFDPNGGIYIMCVENGIASARQLMQWNIGEWYTVSLTMNMDNSTVKVEINGADCGEHSIEPLPGSTLLCLMRHIQSNTTTDTRIFSNSYVSGVIGQRVTGTSSPAQDDKYYFKLDFTRNTAGASRIGQGGALHLNSRQPWTFSGETSSSNRYGSEGILEFDTAVYGGSKKVYLLRTAVWPESQTGDEFKAISDDSSALYIPNGGTCYVYMDGTNGRENYLLQESKESNTVSWQIKVRFDDTNSTRNVFSMGADRNSCNDFLTFKPDGKFYVKYSNGTAPVTAEGEPWEVGTWYIINLKMRLDVNVFDVYLNDKAIVTNVSLPFDIGTCHAIKYMEQKHPARNSADRTGTLTEREFSNTYIDYVTAEYLEDTPLIWASLTDVENNSGTIKADVTFTNVDTLSAEKNLTALLTVYENDRLCGISHKSISLGSPKSEKVSLKVIGESGKTYKYKLLAFDDGLAPLYEDESQVYPVAEESPIYYSYYTDGTTLEGVPNGAANRAQQANAVRNNLDDVWGASVYKPDGSGNKTDDPMSASSRGNEGILSASGGITAGKKVWWIKTASYPTSNTTAYKGDTSTPSKFNASGGYKQITVLDHNNAPQIAPADFTKNYVFEAKLRFDDYNSDRIVMAPGTAYNSFSEIVKFTDEVTEDGEGIITARNKNADNNAEDKRQNVGTYEAGKWYTVKLVYYFTSEGGEANTQYFSLYLTDEDGVTTALLENAKSYYTLSESNFTNMVFMSVTQPATSTSSPLISNSYLYSITAATTDDEAVISNP